MDFTKAYPAEVNIELLADELRAEFPEVSIRDTECVIHNVTAPDETMIDSILAAHDDTQSTEAQEEQSFVEAMRPIIRDWHKSTITTSEALTAIGTVLDNHLSHKAIVNGPVWVNKRKTANPLADVTLANIIGNANAEAAYLEAVFNYASQVKTWRENTG